MDGSSWYSYIMGLLTGVSLAILWQQIAPHIHWI